MHNSLLHLLLKNGDFLNTDISQGSVATRLWCGGIVTYEHTHIRTRTRTRTHTHTHTFNGPLSGTTQVSRYQKGKTNLDCIGARDSEWQWHQLGHMQICPSLQTNNHASTPPLRFLQVGCPSCRPSNSIKALNLSQVSC